MDKHYIESEYRIAFLDYQLARNEEQQWYALNSMARLEQLASQLYGFEYSDNLKKGGVSHV